TPAGTALAPLQAPAEDWRDYSGFSVLKSVAVRFEPGVVVSMQGGLSGGGASEADSEVYFGGLFDSDRAGPDIQIGQLLGHVSWAIEDLYAQLAMSELGHPGKESLLHWQSWEAWEEAKQMESRLRNGQVYRPWSGKDDETVRWILANREKIAAEISRWQLLLMVQSNHPMDLWVNDADPV